MDRPVYTTFSAKELTDTVDRHKYKLQSYVSKAWNKESHSLHYNRPIAIRNKPNNIAITKYYKHTVYAAELVSQYKIQLYNN